MGYPLVLAVVAALFQLVPQLGPLVSAVLGALVGFSASPGTGLAVLGMYYLVQRLVGAFVGSRVERRVSDLHPAILVLVIVALSQLGWQWIFLAAPVTAVARDLWRYAFGRLGDPPRPAGVLPGRPGPAGVAGVARGRGFRGPRPAGRPAGVRRPTARWSTEDAGSERGMAQERSGPDQPQLTQARVPLEDAAEAFSRRDESGRTPIVVLPERASRVSLQLLLAGAVALAVGIGLWLFQERIDLLLLGVLVAAVLVALGVYRAFLVPVPEGVSALLAGAGATSA